MALVSDPTEEGYNSFVSLDEAQAYFDLAYFPEDAKTWDDLDPDDQERLLATASRRLSALPWTGAPSADGQPLAFPRQYSYGEYGGTDEALSPSWLVALTCETARWLWEGAESRTLSEGVLGLVSSFKAGDMSVTLRDGAAASAFGRAAADLLLSLSPMYVDMSTGHPRPMRMIL